MKKTIIWAAAVVMAVSLAGCTIIEQKANEVKAAASEKASEIGESAKEAVQSVAQSAVESAVVSIIGDSVDMSVPIPDDVDTRWLGSWKNSDGDCIVIKYTDVPDAYVYDILMYSAKDNTAITYCVLPEEVMSDSLTPVYPSVDGLHATITVSENILSFELEGENKTYTKASDDEMMEWMYYQYKVTVTSEAMSEFESQINEELSTMTSVSE